MLPDSVVLKSMIDDATQGEWGYDPAKEYRPGVNGARNIDGPQEGIFSYGGSVTIAVTGPSNDLQSMADAALIALAPALAAEVIRLREECVTGAALVLELRGELEETEAATQDYDHISAVLDGVPVNGPLNPLAARVAKLQAERDEARAEVERLRESVNPSTPEGRFNAYKAARETVVKTKPPKIAGPWEELGPAYCPWERRDAIGRLIVAANEAGYQLAGGLKIYHVEGGIDAVLAAADAFIAADGWELLGSSDV